MATDYRALIGDGKCVVCKGPLGAVFMRIRVDRGVINAGAARRHMGLTTFFGGGVGASALAGIFSPDPEPWVKFTADVDALGATSLCLCSGCYCEAPIDVAVLEEAANARAKAAQPDNQEGSRDGEDIEEAQPDR